MTTTWNMNKKKKTSVIWTVFTKSTLPDSANKTFFQTRSSLHIFR